MIFVVLFQTYRDGDFIIGENKGGVDAGQFTGVRHFVGFYLETVEVAENSRP